MKIEDLKEKNKPQELQQAAQTLMKPYIPTVYAIQEEQWKALLTLLTELGLTSVQIKETMKKLPSWKNLQTELNPLVEWIQKSLSQTAEESTTKISNQIQATNTLVEKQLVQMERQMATQLKEAKTDLLKTLKARDLTPTKLRIKWIATGMGAATIFWALLTILINW